MIALPKAPKVPSAIATGELPAKVIGKSWRIKRTDLDEFIDKLF
jgi:excisionase family DNA binding protein